MKMPENFTLFTTVPAFYIKKALGKKNKEVQKIARSIENNNQSIKKKNIFYFLDKTHQENSVKWNTFAQGFNVSDDCDGCGYCEKICSAQNIMIKDGVPVFDDHCVACLACYHRCPKTAIHYGEKTKNKDRYKNPNVNFSKMK